MNDANTQPAEGGPLDGRVRPLVERLRSVAHDFDAVSIEREYMLEAADEVQQLARDNLTLFAEINALKGLLKEALEIADNWPGIAYTADLIERCKKAMPGWALTYE